MNTPKKAPRAAAPSTPRPRAPEGGKAASVASAAPSGLMESAAVPAHWASDGSPLPGNPLLDPGPPPRMPAQPGTWPFGYSRIAQAGRDRDRDALAAITTLREDPAMARYKAEVGQWLDEMDAYEARRG